MRTIDNDAVKNGFSLLQRKRISWLLAVLFIVLAWAAVSFYQTQPCYSLSGTEANLKRYCTDCHNRGGEAKPFAPARFSSSQWERFFLRNKHSRVKELEGIPDVDLKGIILYLQSHAADSDDPVGQPLK